MLDNGAPSFDYFSFGCLNTVFTVKHNSLFLLKGSHFQFLRALKELLFITRAYYLLSYSLEDT